MERALVFPDGLRRWAYRAMVPWLGPLVADRERRLAWLCVLVVLASFVGSWVAPLWVLALGPIVWGIPHLLGDVRYLVLRPGFHRRWPVIVAVGGPLLWCALGGGMLAGVAAPVGACLVASGAWWRRATALLVSASLVVFALRYESTFSLAFAHAHNWIGVLWLLVMSRGSRHGSWLLLSLIALSAVFFAVPLDWLAFPWPVPSGMGWHYHVSVLAPPGLGVGGVRWVLSFAFLQSVHYAVWTRLVPEVERPRPAPRSFRATARALARECGKVPVLMLVLSMLAFGVFSVLSLREARDGYLRFALFHGHLELAMAVLWWCSPRGLGRVSRGALVSKAANHSC